MKRIILAAVLVGSLVGGTSAASAAGIPPSIESTKTVAAVAPDYWCPATHAYFPYHSPSPYFHWHAARMGNGDVSAIYTPSGARVSGTCQFNGRLY